MEIFFGIVLVLVLLIFHVWYRGLIELIKAGQATDLSIMRILVEELQKLNEFMELIRPAMEKEMEQWHENNAPNTPREDQDAL